MARTSKTIRFSLPLELADRVDEILKQEECTRSALLRTALIRHIEECEWRQLFKYGERRTKDTAIGPEDVGILVEEFRAETDAFRS